MQVVALLSVADTGVAQPSVLCLHPL
eukprot:SAG22_NODE_15310_length_352_cov_0.537549_1_plen_25_part_10